MEGPGEGSHGQWRRNHSSSSDKHEMKAARAATPQKTSTTCPSDMSEDSNKNSRAGLEHNPTTKKQQQEPTTKTDRVPP
jgi:hypothetical protein